MNLNSIGFNLLFESLYIGKLDKMVAKLQVNGVESTPYNDKIW